MTDYVGKWDCSYCHTKGINGYVYDCPNCSHPRSRFVKFYLPVNPEVATPEQMELMGRENPNWYCLRCDSGNHADRDTCMDCGAPREDSPSHKITDYGPGEVPHSADDVDSSEQELPAWHSTEYRDYDLYETIKPVKETIKNSLPTIGIAAILILVVIASIGLGFLVYQFFFNTHTTTAYIDSFSWSRNVAAEEYKTLHEEGWSIPFGGRETDHYIKQSGTRRVSDGFIDEPYTDTCYRTESVSSTCYRSVYNSRTCTRDNGNGSFSTYDCGSYENESYSCTTMESIPYSCTKTRPREIYHFEPVYNTWYEYDIERWVNIANYPTGANDHEPFYDQSYQPGNDLFRRIEQQGTYITYFICEETGDFDRKFPLEEWQKQAIGDEYIVTTNFLKVVLDVEMKNESISH